MPAENQSASQQWDEMGCDDRSCSGGSTACTHACRKLFSQHSFRALPPGWSFSHSREWTAWAVATSSRLLLQLPLNFNFNIKSQSNVAAEGNGENFLCSRGRRFVNNKQVECKLSVAARENRKQKAGRRAAGGNKIISGHSAGHWPRWHLISGPAAALQSRECECERGGFPLAFLSAAARKEFLVPPRFVSGSSVLWLSSQFLASYLAWRTADQAAERFSSWFINLFGDSHCIDRALDSGLQGPLPIGQLHLGFDRVPLARSVLSFSASAIRHNGCA